MKITKIYILKRLHFGTNNVKRTIKNVVYIQKVLRSMSMDWLRAKSFDYMQTIQYVNEFEYLKRSKVDSLLSNIML